MATQFEIDCALMAGCAYRSNRYENANWFPVPNGWSEIELSHMIASNGSGFEAVSFKSGNKIVISFAGTDKTDITGDWSTDLNLATGNADIQLLQAAEYYLYIKTTNPSGTEIVFTGHSLGGGLAALMGVFFSKQAVTFDQAPFAGAANEITKNYIKNYLLNLKDQNQQPLYTMASLQILAPELLSYTNSDLGNRVCNISGYYVQGEALTSSAPWDWYHVIDSPDPITHGATSISDWELHSASLLTAFLEDLRLSEVTKKLTSLLDMIYDSNLYYNDPNNQNRNENFLERLVRYQEGTAPGVTASNTLMLTRFTDDMEKITQNGDLSTTDEDIIKTLIAFDMQFYYKSALATTPAVSGYDITYPELFDSNGVTGGVHFKPSDLAAPLETTKGYKLYFKHYLNFLPGAEIEMSALTDVKKNLPKLLDWYIQAGTSPMSATAGSQNAFMLGGTGNDSLWGGSANDVLLGGQGNDQLVGGGGNDILIGGTGNDSIWGGAGENTIYGGYGDDYIIGGEDKDIIYGGYGNDSIWGGAGNDVLIGGPGIDTLMGGAGADTYVFYESELGSGGSIIDKIIDDGVGDKIVFRTEQGDLVQPWSLIGNYYKQADGTWTKILTWADGVATQVITFLYDEATAIAKIILPSAEAYEISNFQSGDFGINLINSPVTASSYNTITLDTQDPDDTDHRDMWLDNLSTLASDKIIGGSGNDVIINDGIAGGNDWLQGGAGNDFIQSFTISDDSVLEGDAGVDALMGGGGSDQIFCGTSDTNGDGQIDTMEQMIGQGEEATNLAYMGDLAEGGDGNDFIYGSDAKDGLFGGEGNDLLVGGGGDDIIFGDGNSFYIDNSGRSVDYWNWSYAVQYDEANQTYTPHFTNINFVSTNYAGDDVIYAGAGNDYVDGGGGNDIYFIDYAGGNNVFCLRHIIPFIKKFKHQNKKRKFTQQENLRRMAA